MKIYNIISSLFPCSNNILLILYIDAILTYFIFLQYSLSYNNTNLTRKILYCLGHMSLGLVSAAYRKYWAYNIALFISFTFMMITRVRGITCSAFAQRSGRWRVWPLAPNNSCNSLPYIVRTSKDKGRAIKGLVVSYVVRLGSMKGNGLRTCARCTGLVPCCGQHGYIELKYRNTPYKHNTT